MIIILKIPFITTNVACTLIEGKMEASEGREETLDFGVWELNTNLCY